MVAEIAGLVSLEAAWILSFMHIASLKSNKNCDPFVIHPSKTQ